MINCVLLVRQHGIAHDGGAPAFAACDILIRLPHFFCNVGVDVPQVH